MPHAKFGPDLLKTVAVIRNRKTDRQIEFYIYKMKTSSTGFDRSCYPTDSIKAM